MNARPLYPEPALLLEGSLKYVAVSDLHIGLESEYSLKGIDLAHSAVANEMSRRIRELAVANNADGIILLGDLKHRVGSVSRQEWDEVPRFLTQLAGTAAVYLVPGNHDGSMMNLIPSDIRVASAAGMLIEDTLFLHGHSMPSDLRSGVKNIVMGHVHPILRKKGSVVDGKPVWLYVEIDKSALFAGQKRD
ncbi:MAG TPA: metallophosphoesterase, partial [Nitrososphaera sp.]|nr:metallophosphoesterase [Nitrososphaera sp.]